MRRPLLAALLCLLALPSAALGAPKSEELRIPTRDGDEIHVELSRPDGPVKVPIILTYSPYNSIGGVPGGNLAEGDPFVAKGYARAYADVIGTRNSTGCWDYGGLKEQRSGVDLVNALAKLPWSNGKVAMVGVSYEGTTANMVAAAGDEAPGLASIVPIAAISRWYGYAYQDGVRYAGNSKEPTDEGADTPLGFDLGFGRTPPDRPTGAPAALGRIQPCDVDQHTLQGYDTTPDYDKFWLERDYRKDAARFRVPAFVVHGWQDFNVKQSEGIDLYEEIPVDDPATAKREGVPFKLLHMSQEPHANGTGDDYAKRLERFFERTLKGIDNGIEFEESVRTLPRIGEAKAEKFARTTAWPPPGTRTVALQLGQIGSDRVMTPTAAAEPKSASFTDTGQNTEEAAIQSWGDELPGQLVYLSKSFEADTRLAGSAVLKAKLKLSGGGGQLSPTLVDVSGDGTVTVTPITRGHLNLRYRKGLAKAEDVPAGETVDATVTFAPQDQIIKKGHAVGLILAGSNTVWAVPDEERPTIEILHGLSRLELPVVGPVDAAAGIPGVAPAVAPRPAVKQRGPKLRVSVRRVRNGLLRVTVRGPARARVSLKAKRGPRTVGAKRVTLSRKGLAKVLLKVRGGGRVRVLATGRVVGGGKVQPGRSKLIAARTSR